MSKPIRDSIRGCSLVIVNRSIKLQNKMDYVLLLQPTFIIGVDLHPNSKYNIQFEFHSKIN